MIPQIFDLNKVLKQKSKSIDYYTKDAFLHIYALEDMIDRLNYINHDFKKILCVNITPFMWKKAGGEYFTKINKVNDIDHLTYLPSNCYNQKTYKIIDEDLRLKNNQYDLILCPLTIHIFNDLPGILKQFHNSLKKDGIFMANIIGENFLHNLQRIFMEAEIEVTKGASSSHVHPAIDVRLLGDLIHRTGFTLPVTDIFNFEISYKDIKKALKDIKYMGERNSLHSEQNNINIKVFKKAIKKAEEKYKRNGIFKIDIDMVSLIGRSPSDKQQRPLKPGSAEVNLNKFFSK